MADQPYVIDEVLATGVVRTEVFGELDPATLAAARRVLGGLRTQHGVNERIALGQPGGFYYRSVLLADGTRIVAITNDGLDTLRIYPTTSKHPGPKSHPVLEKIPYPRVVICGVCYEASGIPPIAHAVVWEGGGPPRDLGLLDGYDHARATAISEDANTVVGYCYTSLSDGAAFRWSAKTGMQALGTLRPDHPVSRATDVNRDGSVIVGTDFARAGAAYPETGWVWRVGADPVMSELPQPAFAMGMPLTSRVVVSPSGQYIAGVVNTLLSDNQNQDGAYWINDDARQAPQGPFALPPPGTSGRIPIGGHQHTEGQRDFSRPTNVTDGGVVSGDTAHSEVYTYISTTTFYDVGGGVPGGFESGVEGPPSIYYDLRFPGSNPLFSYTVAGKRAGEYKLVAAEGQSAGAADDGSAAIGNRRIGIKGDIYLYDPPPPANPSSLVRTYGVYLSYQQNGWVLRSRTGLQSLGIGSETYDIAENGSIVVGCVRDSADRTQPASWDRNGTLTRLPLLPGTTHGIATGVTVIDPQGEITNTRMAPDP